jgi:hypothetical protein
VETLFCAAKKDFGTPFSPLLASAIVFAASAYFDDTHLKALGFKARLEARATLYARVKVLYEADVETNRLALVQVLLLMTLWYGQQNDIKGRFYWLRTAISLATDIGLHLSLKEVAADEEAYLRRRIWSCCLMRVALLSITERIPCLNGIATDDHRHLEVDHFFDQQAAKATEDLYVAHHLTSSKLLLQLWLSKLKLCLIALTVLETQYEARGKRRLDATRVIMVLVPKSNTEIQSHALSNDRELGQWRATAANTRETCFDHDHRCNGSVLGTVSAVLEMLYNIVLSMVHRPLVRKSDDSDSALAFLQGYSKQKLRYAARRITEVGRQTMDGDVARFLPPIVVGACILASIQHLKDAQGDAEVKFTGRVYLDQTMTILSILSSTYNAASCALQFIARVRDENFASHSFEWANEDEADRTTQHQVYLRSRESTTVNYASRKTADAGAIAQTDGQQLLSSVEANGQSIGLETTMDPVSAFPLDIPELMFESFDFDCLE